MKKFLPVKFLYPALAAAALLSAANGLHAVNYQSYIECRCSQGVTGYGAGSSTELQNCCGYSAYLSNASAIIRTTCCQMQGWTTYANGACQVECAAISCPSGQSKSGSTYATDKSGTGCCKSGGACASGSPGIYNNYYKPEVDQAMGGAVSVAGSWQQQGGTTGTIFKPVSGTAPTAANACSYWTTNCNQMGASALSCPSPLPTLGQACCTPFDCTAVANPVLVLRKSTGFAYSQCVIQTGGGTVSYACYNPDNSYAGTYTGNLPPVGETYQCVCTLTPSAVRCS